MKSISCFHLFYSWAQIAPSYKQISWKPLTIITMSFILDVAAALDSPLIDDYQFTNKLKSVQKHDRGKGLLWTFVAPDWQNFQRFCLNAALKCKIPKNASTSVLRTKRKWEYSQELRNIHLIDRVLARLLRWCKRLSSVKSKLKAFKGVSTYLLAPLRQGLFFRIFLLFLWWRSSSRTAVYSIFTVFVVSWYKTERFPCDGMIS